MSTLSEVGLPSLNSYIQTNLHELERLVRDLEDCVENLKKAIDLHLKLSCSSSSHSKNCQSLRNAECTIQHLAKAQPNPHFVPCRFDFDEDKVIESDELSPPSFLLWMSSILQNENDQPSKFMSNLDRAKSIGYWKDYTDWKTFKEAHFQNGLISRLTTGEYSRRKMNNSFCEILQVAQQNLDNAVLAIKQYEMVALDISSVMVVEEKVIITRARELCRSTNVFEKMTKCAIIKLNSVDDENSDENSF